MEEIKEELFLRLIKIISKKIIARASAALAFLPSTIVATILGFVIEKLGTAIVKELFALIRNAEIDERIEREVREAKEVIDELHEYERHPENYTEEQKEELDQRLIDKYRNMFRP